MIDIAGADPDGRVLYRPVCELPGCGWQGRFAIGRHTARSHLRAHMHQFHGNAAPLSIEPRGEPE